MLIGPGGAQAAAAVPAAVVHVAEHDAFAAFAPDAWAATVCETADRIGATAIVAPGSAPATDVMARAAARLGEPLAANCVAVKPGDPLALTRIRWGGSLLEEASLRTGRALLTVAPHTVAATAAGSPGSVEVLTPGSPMPISSWACAIESRRRREASRWRTPTWSSRAAGVWARPRASP